MTVSPALLAGRYRLLDPLGSGGMGRVWLARDEVLHRDVAIKEVHLPLDLTPAERDELRERTLREARTAAQLSDPNVVQIYDVLGVDDRPWIVMEYIRSESLQHLIATDGPLSPQRAAEIGLAVLNALVAAHRAGVLHRDVKPGNVLIAEDGRVVLTDFGLATFDGGEGSVTRPGLVWGSPEYVAPERAQVGVSSVEADLWSLGATLFAAVEGRSPFARSTVMATLTALATEKPPVPRRAGPLKPVLTGLLRRDPRARLRPSELDRLLRRAAGVPRPHGRLLPRQRPVPPLERMARPSARIRAYSLPEPPMGVSQDRPIAAAPMPGQVGPSRRAWLIAVASVAVTLAIAAGLIVANRDRPAVSPVAGSSPVTSAPARTSSPPPLVVAAPRRSGENAMPSGWTHHSEPGRFRVGVPIGWVIEREGPTVRFRESVSGRNLAVEVMVPAPAEGALAAVRRRDAAWTTGMLDGDTAPPPRYHSNRVTAVAMGDGGPTAGAEWEYTFTDPQLGEMQVLSRHFTSGGRGFAVSWTTRGYDFGNSRGFYDLAIGGFSPQA